VRQKQPRGLGHAVMCGAPFTDDEAFYVMLGDELVPDCSVLPKMRAVHDETGASVIAVVPAPEDQVHRYGVIAGEPVTDGVWRVNGLVEKPEPGEQPSNLRIFGRYLLTPTVMEILASTPPGRGGEIQLTDALVKLLEREEIYAVVIEPRCGRDTGNVLAWLEANVALALERDDYGPALREVLRRLLEQ
jgi:UTP--glucose-1-phosphate uridylyltransferase